jgi:hypothetical protein
VAPAIPYLKHWRVYPQDGPGRSCILLDEVDAFAESPRRLPARFANKVYAMEETGKDVKVFTVIFNDGYRQASGAGTAVDFIRYPEGLGPADVVDVVRFQSPNAEIVRSPEYYWCLFAE